VVEKVEHVLDSETLERHEDRDVVERNNVAVCSFRTIHPISYDFFEECEATGRFVLVDNYQIAGGGTIIESLSDVKDEEKASAESKRDEFERDLNAFVRKWYPHWEAKKID
jgi:sulfate adenylyltransferase subunit 1 (EFTu-like GTPase family)